MLDIAVLYAPQHRPGLKIEFLFEEKLVLVTTDPDASRLPTSLAIDVSLIVY